MTNLTQVPMYISLSDLIELSINSPTGEVDCSFTIEHEGKSYHVYTASIAHRDILCYTDQGTFTFLVDTYGGRHTCELFDWILDSDDE